MKRSYGSIAFAVSLAAFALAGIGCSGGGGVGGGGSQTGPPPPIVVTRTFPKGDAIPQGGGTAWDIVAVTKTLTGQFGGANGNTSRFESTSRSRKTCRTRYRHRASR